MVLVSGSGESVEDEGVRWWWTGSGGGSEV